MYIVIRKKWFMFSFIQIIFYMFRSFFYILQNSLVYFEKRFYVAHLELIPRILTFLVIIISLLENLTD